MKFNSSLPRHTRHIFVSRIKSATPTSRQLLSSELSLLLTPAFFNGGNQVFLEDQLFLGMRTRTLPTNVISPTPVRPPECGETVWHIPSTSTSPSGRNPGMSTGTSRKSARQPPLCTVWSAPPLPSPLGSCHGEPLQIINTIPPPPPSRTITPSPPIPPPELHPFFLYP